MKLIPVTRGPAIGLDLRYNWTSYQKKS